MASSTPKRSGTPKRTSGSSARSTASRSGSSRKSGTKKSTAQGSSARSSRSKKAAQQPIRREVWALILVILALCVMVSYCGVRAILIDWLAVLLKGLFGYGYWLAAPSLLLASSILFFHHGRPVQLRTTCALLLPLLLGTLGHILFAPNTYESGWSILAALWKDGLSLQGGGAVSGALAEGAVAVFSKIAAVVIFTALFLIAGMVSLRTAIAVLLDRHRNRPEYEEDPDWEEPAIHLTPIDPPPRRRTEPQSRPVIDIPLDDGPLEAPKKKPVPAEQEKEDGRFTSFFRHKSDQQRTPDQVLRQQQAEARRPIASDTAPKQSVQSTPTTVPKPAPVIPPAAAEPSLPPEPRPVLPVAPLRPVASAVQEEAPISLQKPVSAVSEPQETPVTPDPSPVTAPDDLETFFAPATTAAPAVPEQPVVPAEPTVLPLGSTAQQIVQKPQSAVPTAAPTAPQEVQKPLAVAAAVQTAAASPAAPVSPTEEGYQYPPLDLLTENQTANHIEAGAELRNNARRLADTLTSFGVDATPGDVVHGPSVTRYEFVLDQGVKLSKITNLADDIALALGATGVRIAPIPDKISVVGIEVPNKQVTPVLIRDVIDSREFREHKSKVAFALGKDISGENIIGNIEKLPHVLIAGTTGSGKSVCTNSLIVSLLYKSTPDEVRFIMVDPKMVELAPYNGIPHLLIPVVTDPKKAAGALQWAVFEMMKRYKTFSECGVKKLEEFNKLAATREDLQRLPSVVVVIDELADLMLVAAKEVEESICRVAQMGRAAGVHLVIATQRPSADVITGLMKANIPSRIAFAVASSLESRIILDTTGAEKLVGKGDMLYAPLGVGKPIRVQGCFISPEEIENVVQFVKQTGEAQYSDEVMAKIEESIQEKEGKGGRGAQSAADASGDDSDELLPAAVEVILETGQASVSMLQRRLKLGYSRAARLVDQMEERGIVGPFEGSKPRQLLITKAQWQEMQMAGETDPADDAAAAERRYNL